MRHWSLVLIPSIGVAVLAAAAIAPPSGDAEVVPASLAPAPAPLALPGWAAGRTVAIPDRLDALDAAAAYAAPIPPRDDEPVSAMAIVLPRCPSADEQAVGEAAAGSSAGGEHVAADPADAAAREVGAQPTTAREIVAASSTEPAQPDAQPAAAEPEPTVSLAGERRALLHAASRWISRYEGSRRTAYFDHRGNRTVGIGCNLDAGDGDERLAAVDADYSAVRSGEEGLSDAQVAQLFARDLSHAVREAERLVPDLYEHPPAVRVLVVDLVYTAGPTGFCRFRATRAALAAHDYPAVAASLPQTRWYRQVHDRARAHVAALRALTPSDGG